MAMAAEPKHTLAVLNPALEPLARLVGEWETTGTHPLVPGITLHGHSSFKWMEGGAFLVWCSSIDHPAFPTGTSIIGSDDATGEYCMLYFDERKVSRKYNVSFLPEDGVIKWWRHTPGFSQMYTWTFVDAGVAGADTIVGEGKISKDGIAWEGDLNLKFVRKEDKYGKSTG